MMSQNTKISNFHTHTKMCKHADGEPIDYYNQAVIDGCTFLGFSDHCPYPSGHDETWPEVRMTEKEISIYVNWIRSLQKKNTGENAPKIFLGFECEFDTEFKSWYEDELIGKAGADYLAFGAHWVKNENSFDYIPRVNSIPLMHKYFDNVIKGMQSGLFSFLAHPDLIMTGWRNWTKELESCFISLIDAAISCDIPLEINGLGLVRQKVLGDNGFRHPYPVDNFWELVKEKGAKVICNADAHSPLDVIKNAKLAREYANKFGLVPIENPLG